MNKIVNLALFLLAGLGFVSNASAQVLSSVCVFEYNNKPYEWSRLNSGDWFYFINDSGQAVGDNDNSDYPRIYFYDSNSFFGRQAASFTQFSGEYTAFIRMYAKAFNNDGMLFGDVYLANPSPVPGQNFTKYSNAFAFSWDAEQGFVDLATVVPGITGRGEIGWDTRISNDRKNLITYEADASDYVTPIPFPIRDRQHHITQQMLDSITQQCGSSPSYSTTPGTSNDSNANLEFISGRNIVRFPAANLSVNASHWWYDDDFYYGNTGQLSDRLNFRIRLDNLGGVDVYSLTTSIEVSGNNNDAFTISLDPSPTSVDAKTNSDYFYAYLYPQKVGTYTLQIVVKGLDEFNSSFEAKSTPRTFTVVSSEPQLNANLKFTDGRSRSIVGLTETFGLSLEISASEGEHAIENIVLTDPFTGAPNIDVISAPDFPPAGYTLEPNESRTLQWTLKPNSGGAFRFATTVSGLNADEMRVEDGDSLSGTVVSEDLTVEIALSPEEPQLQEEEIGGDPEPIEFTVDAQVCNNTGETITQVKLNSLDIRSAAGLALFVEKIDGPVPVTELDLGTILKYQCVPIPRSRFVATDDGEIKVDALATALSSVGARLTDIDVKTLVIKPKYFMELSPRAINPPEGELLPAGLQIRIGGTVKNLSNTHKLQVGPLFAELDGNAGAQSFAWNAQGSEPDAFVLPEYPLVIEPGGEREFSMRVTTAASDPRHDGSSDGKPTGGTRAIINFIPWAVAEHPDGTRTPIKPDSMDTYNVPDELKNNESDLELMVSVKDDIAIPVANNFAIAAGVTLGGIQAAYDMGTGLLKAPFVLLDGFASLLWATGEYQHRIWDAFTEEEKALFANDVGLLAGTILLKHYELAQEIDPQQLLDQVNALALQQMTEMAEEWELGDYTQVATQYSRAGGQVVSEVAFGAALWKLGKYQKAAQVLQREQSLKNLRARALLESANIGEDFVDLKRVEQILLTGEAGVEATIDDIVKLFGYTPDEIARLQATLNRFPGTMMTTRSKSARSVFWREIFQALGKPEALKAKGVNWLDELLGYPKIYGGYSSVGAMVFKKPDFMVLAEQSGRTWGQEILSHLAARNIQPGDALYDQAVSRLLLRAEEWKKYERTYKKASELGYLDVTFDTGFNSISDNTAALIRKTDVGGVGLGTKRHVGFRLRKVSEADSPFETYVMEMRGNDGRFKPVTGDVDNTGFTRTDNTALDELLHAEVTEAFYGAGLAEHGDTATARVGVGGVEFIAKQAEGTGGVQELVLQWKAGENLPRLVRFNKNKSVWNGPRDFRLNYDGGWVDVGNSVGRQGPKPPLNIPTTPPPSLPSPDRVALSISAPPYDGSANAGRCQLFYSKQTDASSVIMGSDGRLAEVGPDGTIAPSELHDFCFSEGSTVSVGIAPSTMLSADIDSGSTTLTVLTNGSGASTTGASTVAGFKKGQRVVIGADTDHSEIRHIVGLGSIVLDQALEFDHGIGEVIVVVEQQDQPPPALDEDNLNSLKNLFDAVSGATGAMQYADGKLKYSGNGLNLNIALSESRLSENGVQPGAEIGSDGGLTIHTGQGQTIIGNAGLIDASLFEALLAELDLVFNESATGQILVGGALNTGPQFYSMLPAYIIDAAAPGTGAGIEMIPSATVNNLLLITLISTDSGVPQRQTLYPAPVDWKTLQNAFLAMPGVSKVELGMDGIIAITLDGVIHLAIMDYVVNRAVGEVGATSIVLGDDVNGDNLPDILVTYPDGNQQVMYFLGVR